MGIIDFREIVSAKADHASVKNAPVGTSALPDDFETFCRDFFDSLRVALVPDPSLRREVRNGFVKMPRAPMMKR